MQRFVTVVGSYRAAEAGMWEMRRPRLFETLAFEIGAWALRSGNNLRIGWSNDHLRGQVRPSKDHGDSAAEAEYQLEKNEDGTRTALAEDCRFIFQHTADYHAMRGFLEAARENGSQGNYLHLDVSDEMWSGKPKAGMIKWPPVAQATFGGKPLGSNAIVRRHPIDGSERTFRSSYLTKLLKDTGSNAVEAVFAIGGGKASGTSYDAAPGKIIPIGYCGGEADVRLRTTFADRRSSAYERLSYLFGAEMPSTAEDQIDVDDALPETLSLLARLEDFFCCPFHVFVAFPYGRTDEEKTFQNLLFQHVEQAIRRLKEEFPQRYCGARAIRGDGEIVCGQVSIDRELLAFIQRSGVVLAELTPVSRVSGSVYIELGYAMAFKHKKILLMAKKETEIPFDIAGRQIHWWVDLDEFERKVHSSLRRLFDVDVSRSA